MRILYSWLVFTFILNAGLMPAQGNDDILVSREHIILPEFQAIAERPGIHFYTDPHSYAKAKADEDFSYELLTYLSDGIEVKALLYRALDGVAKPTIIFNRGSYVRHDTAPEYLVTFNRLAKMGFNILAPMYRGSEGAEGRDEMGGADLNDLMITADLAKELPSLDANALYLLGESRGGMMSYMAARAGYPAMAMATYGAPVDFYHLISELGDHFKPMADIIWPEWEADPDLVFEPRSAVNWSNEINVPVLIMHGANDQSIPVSQSLKLASNLEEAGADYALIIFPYDNHTISHDSEGRDIATARWFKRHPKH